MKSTYKKNYNINIYDVNSNHRCKVSTLANYLWDVVISQSDSLGASKDGISHDNYAWVLLKYDIKIYQYPRYKDIVNVSTRVSGYKKFYGYRDYSIKDLNSNILVEAKSTAITIDINKRRPTKVSSEQYKAFGLTEELDKAPLLDDIKELDRIDFTKDYPIRYSDIDLNNHVNNVKYIEMVLDTLPRFILKDYMISNIKILFKKETTDGATIHIETQIIESSDNNSILTIHKITENNKLLTKLEFEHKKE